MSRSDYLSFGGSSLAGVVDAEGTLAYLKGLGYSRGDLQQSRDALVARSEVDFTFDPISANYCDFCFAQIMGGEFDQLKDGRDRCIKCSRTVITTQEEFQELFDQVRRNVELAFNINLKVPIVVRMVNANKIARETGETFQPTPGVDGRVLGFATKSREGCSLYIENGSPRQAAMSTLAHELTHIWQYFNWSDAAIRSQYGAKNELSVYEGMAMWAQVQYLFFVREFDYAVRQEAQVQLRTDAYGVGFAVFAERYPLQRNGEVAPDSPFRYPLPL